MDWEAIWRELISEPIAIDGGAQIVRVECDEVRLAYAPLADRLWARQRSLGRRLLVGISGLPGGGKTVTAAVLARVLAITGRVQGADAICLGLDGFHRPNHWLERHTGPDHDGRIVVLRQIKGAPITFDVEAAIQRLERVRQGEGEVRFPIYSRELHDPIPDAVAVTKRHRIVLFEGNYLFLDDPPWPRLRALFDVRLFVETPEPARLANLRERHRRGGKTEEQIKRQMAVDGRNAALIAPTARYAHCRLIRSADGMRLVEVVGMEALS